MKKIAEVEDNITLKEFIELIKRIAKNKDEVIIKYHNSKHVVEIFVSELTVTTTENDAEIITLI